MALFKFRFFFKQADTLSRKKNKNNKKKTIVRKTPHSTGGMHRRATKCKKTQVESHNARQCSVKGRQRTPRTRKIFYGQTLQMHGFLYKHMGAFKEPQL